MRAKLFGMATLALACALLASSGATSQPPGKGTGATSVVIPGGAGYGAPDGDLSGFDLRQLVEELARVRQEKAALERRERALLALIPKRIDAQRKELDDLEKHMRALQAGKEGRTERKK